MMRGRHALFASAAGSGGSPQPPPNYGPELVVNGTFDSDTASWTTGTTFTQVGGKGRLLSTGGDNAAHHRRMTLGDPPHRKERPERVATRHEREQLIRCRTHLSVVYACLFLATLLQVVANLQRKPGGDYD